LRRERALQVAVDDAGFDDGDAIVRVDAQDAVHALEAGDDAAARGHARAGGVGAAAARDERQAMRAARTHERDDLFMRRREHDRVGHRLAARVVVAVGQAVAGVGAERVGEDRAQVGAGGGGQCGIRHAVVSGAENIAASVGLCARGAVNPCIRTP
jgi:hypothetical protein